MDEVPYELNTPSVNPAVVSPVFAIKLDKTTGVMPLGQMKVSSTKKLITGLPNKIRMKLQITKTRNLKYGVRCGYKQEPAS